MSDGRVHQSGSYAELKQLIQQAGLLEKRPGYLLAKIAFNLCLLAISITILFLTDRFAIQLLNAVLMAFVWVQMAFIIHDTGHRQAFKRTRTNDIVGMLHGNFLSGGSYAWWMSVHNEHHASPNTPDEDPHIMMPMLAFSPEEALTKRGLMRFMVKHQTLFFFPLLLFLPLSQHANSFSYLRDTRWKYRRVEIALWLAHIAWYSTMLILALGIPKAIIFMLVHRGLVGLYEGSIFAPNHKGMPLIAKGTKIDFVRQQVLTARNVSGGALVDLWYGGLNFQIEHHLFPTLPRNHLRAAQRIIKMFCATHDIEYYEVGVRRSYVEILQALSDASAPLREKASAVVTATHDTAGASRENTGYGAS